MQSVTTTNMKTGFTISFDLLGSWLRLMREKTQDRDIEHAMRTIQFVTLTDEERDIVGTIRSLYIAEMNGNLSPAPSIRGLYSDLCEQVKLS